MTHVGVPQLRRDGTTTTTDLLVFTGLDNALDGEVGEGEEGEGEEEQEEKKGGEE